MKPVWQPHDGSGSLVTWATSRQGPHRLYKVHKVGEQFQRRTLDEHYELVDLSYYGSLEEATDV